MKTNILKGETVSDYFLLLKGAFAEADMAKESIGTIICQLKEVKAKSRMIS